MGLQRVGHGLAAEHACMHLDGSLDAAVTTCLLLVGRCGMVRGRTFWAQQFQLEEERHRVGGAESG